MWRIKSQVSIMNPTFNCCSFSESLNSVFIVNMRDTCMQRAHYDCLSYILHLYSAFSVSNVCVVVRLIRTHNATVGTSGNRLGVCA
jgi:hypothetical protein